MAKSDVPTVVQRLVALDGIELHLAEAGAGPLVVLLHGFPDFWYSWRHQLGPLAEAGWHAVAPDMRGYNMSEKPVTLFAYRLDQLADDVAALIEALGEREAALVGHDWGGIVAWHTALRHPARISRLAVLNAPPPPSLLAKALPADQFLKSWYVAAFQLPFLPEALLSLDGFAALKRTLRAEVKRPQALGAEELAHYEAAWGQPGALTAMLNYYRALPWFGPWETARAAGGDRRLRMPVLVIWGQQDPHLAPALAEPSPERVPQAQVVRLAHAGHWVHWDEPERVNDLLLDFLRSSA